MLKLICILMVICFSSANAFIISTYKKESIQYDLPTRVLVTGDGRDQETQFQELANSKALKYSELYPDEQIVLLAKNESKFTSTNKNLLRSWGFIIQSDKSNTFSGEALVRELAKFSKIASIDIFSHGAAQFGLYLENSLNRLSVTTLGIDKLKGHFTEDAFIFMHGCNTGFILAPFISKILEIPVAASLTSTDFQKLHSDGDFYLTDKGFYPNSDWARKNKISYKNESGCRYGKCLRLKPDNHPYIGYWGEYFDGGLPFYKFFCPNVIEEKCKRVMAKSLFSFIGTTNLTLDSGIEDYKKALVDFLCPISAKRNIRSECEMNLENALLTKDDTYSPFKGVLLDCNFKNCNFDFKCSRILSASIPDAKKCSLINKSNRKATTLVKEYRAYLSGFDLIKNKKINR